MLLCWESLEGSGVFCFNWRALSWLHVWFSLERGLEKGSKNSPPNPTMNIKHVIQLQLSDQFFSFSSGKVDETTLAGDSPCPPWAFHRVHHGLLFVPGISCLGMSVPVRCATCFSESGIWFVRRGHTLCQGALLPFRLGPRKARGDFPPGCCLCLPETRALPL